jgi:uncharacterized protein (TIGR04222 family)
MTSVLPLIGLVGALVTTMLATWGRRQWLRAPRGSAARVLDVYDLAYLAGGPERAVVALVEALVRGHAARVDEAGTVRLPDDWIFGEKEPPGHAGLAAAVRHLTSHGGSMPLARLADALRRDPVMKEPVTRLRRWHLLLPAGYKPPLWPRSVVALAGVCGAAGAAWSAATGKTPGVVTGVIGVLLAAGGWWLASRRPPVPVTDAGREVLVETYTHYRRGGMADMAGHGVALRGSDAVEDAVLRERLGELEAAQAGGWTWDPSMLPEQVLTPAAPRNPRLTGGL